MKHGFTRINKAFKYLGEGDWVLASPFEEGTEYPMVITKILREGKYVARDEYHAMDVVVDATNIAGYKWCTA